MEKSWLRVEAWTLGSTASDGMSRTLSSKPRTQEYFQLRNTTSTTTSTRPSQSSRTSRTATRSLSLNIRERGTPSHWTLIILIAAEFEVAHHCFGVFAPPERERVEFESILPGVWCFWRVVGFMDEPAGIAVEPSICFFQATTAGFDEEVIYEGQQ